MGDQFSTAIKDIVTDAVREVAPGLIGEALEQYLPEIMRRAALPIYLDKKQLQELTGWSSRKIDYMRSRGEIPFIRRGRTILFPTDEIEAYLREGYVPAAKCREPGND